MGQYINAGNDQFKEIRRDIYVDKTGLIIFMNQLIENPKPLIIFSRPRRFGKTYDASMICAYYDRTCDSKELFADLKIAKDDSFEKHLNKYNVIKLDMSDLLYAAQDNKSSVTEDMRKTLMKHLDKEFPNCIDKEDANLGRALYSIVANGNEKFVFIIDEWDVIFRELKYDVVEQNKYIRFLRNLFKNGTSTSYVVAAAYMTGILPIKKYGTESALSDFKEFSMIEPDELTEYVGFTEGEVKRLCKDYSANYEDIQIWYDGYTFEDSKHVYNSNSVITAIKKGKLKNYWMQSETFDSLKNYISMNYDGLKTAIIEMLAGNHVKVEVDKFHNDFATFNNKYDVLTLLIHLGYLAYDSKNGEAYIPNLEVSAIFKNAIEGKEWAELSQTLSNSEDLLRATLRCDGNSVANALEMAHESVSSILQYNNEESLSCAITIAYYTAKRYYMTIRELPTGKGFADVVFLPRPGIDKPAIIVELKYDKNADTAIRQIHENRYDGELKNYFGNLLLVGINYNKDAKGENAKKHTCVIEKA